MVTITADTIPTTETAEVATLRAALARANARCTELEAARDRALGLAEEGARLLAVRTGERDRALATAEQAIAATSLIVRCAVDRTPVRGVPT